MWARVSWLLSPRLLLAQHQDAGLRKGPHSRRKMDAGATRGDFRTERPGLATFPFAAPPWCLVCSAGFLALGLTAEGAFKFQFCYFTLERVIATSCSGLLCLLGRDELFSQLRPVPAGLWPLRSFAHPLVTTCVGRIYEFVNWENRCGGLGWSGWRACVYLSSMLRST